MSKTALRMKFSGFVKVLVMAAIAIGVGAGAGAEESEAAGEIRVIRDNSTGGDCTTVGIWNAPTKTCTLTTDVYGRFVIESDGITLDGAGHRVTGTGPEDPDDFVPGEDGGGNGVYVQNRSGVTVRNMVMHRFDYSVDLVYTVHSTVTGITSTASGLAGISLSHASYNTISVNTIINPGLNTGICIGFDSDDNLITNNQITGFDRGIYLHTYCSGNRIKSNQLTTNWWGITAWEVDTENLVEDNTVSDGVIGVYLHNGSDSITVAGNTVSSHGTGIQVEGVRGASIFQNSFVDNIVQAQSIGTGENVYDLGLPNGGNHWSDFDSAAEGCLDTDGDVFCDAPLVLGGGADRHPWTSPSGWQCLRPRLELYSPGAFWASYGDYEQRLLSVNWTVENGSAFSADEVQILSSSCTSGVTVNTSLPTTLGALAAGASATEVLKYQVPAGVASFWASLALDFHDNCGSTYDYPAGPGASV